MKSRQTNRQEKDKKSTVAPAFPNKSYRLPKASVPQIKDDAETACYVRGYN